MKTFSKNLVSLFLSDVLRRVLGFFSVALLARVLGVEGFGAVNIALTVLSYVIMTSSAGIHILGVREIARGVDTAIIPKFVAVRFVNAIGVWSVVGIVSFAVVPDHRLAALIALTSASAIINALFLEWYFQGKETMSVIGVARTLSAAAYLAVIYACVRLPQHLLFAGVASIVGEIVCASTFWWYFRRRGGGAVISFRSLSWLNVIKQALPLGAGSIFAHLSVNFPILALGILLSTSAAGVFSAGYKLVVFLLMIDRVLGGLLLPASTRLQAVSVERLKTALNRALKWVLVVGVPICVGGSLLADELLVFIFGHAYLASADVFRIVLWFFLLTMLHTVFTSGLIAIGEEKVYSTVMMISAAIYGTSTIVLVLLKGTTGAAMAMVMSEGITVLLMALQLQKRVPLAFPKALDRLVIAAGLMTVAVLLIKGINIFLVITVGGLVYGCAALLLGAVTRGELSALREKLI